MKIYRQNQISVKRTSEMDHMLEYLEEKLLLNPTAIMRYCLARVYQEELQKEKGGKDNGRKP